MSAYRFSRSSRDLSPLKDPRGVLFRLRVRRAPHLPDTDDAVRATQYADTQYADPLHARCGIST